MVCLCMGTAAVGWFMGDKVVTYVQDKFPKLAEIFNFSTRGVSDEDIQVSETSLSLSSALAGKVKTSNGAEISIPAGAVPPMDNGSAGTMVFSIEPDSSVEAALPGGYEPVGPVYRLGPEGFVFAMPVTITLPIPSDVDPKLVIGLTYYDSATETWKLVPGTVDAEKRTTSASVTHLSLWGLFGRCIGGSAFGECPYQETPDEWHRQHGGWIRINNTHVYRTGSYPGGRNLPTSTGYGVCIATYRYFDEDEDAWNWLPPLDWKILAHDNQTVDFWMPNGEYGLIEFFNMSEVNSDPLYVPEYTSYWRPIGSYTIANGETTEFSSSSVTIDDSFTEGRPPCWGQEDTSVGTGDVQVTLTWQTNDDIDLYVTDPTGETIYYQYTVSSSGGTLDRDNKCDNLIIGRPENIFWAEGQAPSGSYKVQVHYYDPCEAEHAVNWTVRVIVGGDVKTYNGTLTQDEQMQDVVTFTAP